MFLQDVYTDTLFTKNLYKLSLQPYTNIEIIYTNDTLVN